MVNENVFSNKLFIESDSQDVWQIERTCERVTGWFSDLIPVCILPKNEYSAPVVRCLCGV